MTDAASHDWLFDEPFTALTAQRLFEREGAWQAGRIYKRREIADILLDVYRQGRGVEKDLTRGRIIRSIKKKLPGDGEKTEWFEKIDFGRYKYCYRSDGADDSFLHSQESEEKKDTWDSAEKVVPELKFGEGKCEVYVWYLPHYENAGQRWPMKIGSTSEGGFNRRLDDFQENLPEMPRYVIQVRFTTETNARKLEKALHYYFENRGRRIEEVPGTEWFVTNPEEIVEAIGILDPKLIETGE